MYSYQVFCSFGNLVKALNRVNYLRLVQTWLLAKVMRACFFSNNATAIAEVFTCMALESSAPPGLLFDGILLKAWSRVNYLKLVQAWLLAKLMWDRCFISNSTASAEASLAQRLNHLLQAGSGSVVYW